MTPLTTDGPVPGASTLRGQLTGFAWLGLLLAVLPWVTADYQRVFAAEILIWGLFAMSFALVYGWGGMLSFAQAVFFGAGCYGFNVATFYLQWNIWGAIASAVAMAVLFAVPIGYIATRVSHHQFLIVTIIFSVLVSALLSSGHWNWLAGPYITRSLTEVPEVPLGLARLSFLSETVAYYFTVVMVAAAFAVCWLLVHSPFGRALRAVRDNEARARLIGLNVNRLRFLMFVAAAAVAGYGGSLYVLLARYTNLEFFHWSYSGRAVIMAILGGVHTLLGPFVGTAFYMISAEYLSRHMTEFMVVFGVLLLVIIRYAPEGICGLVVRGVNAIRK